jgi:nicotinamide-nucleotide amidase
MSAVDDIATEVLTLAREKGLRIAAVESCTGGLLMGALTAIAGSSDVVERGFVTYSNEAKTEMVGVPAPLIDEHGAVSEPVARAMAEGGLRASHADLCLSITGVAGPGASAAKPEGRVCFGLAQGDEVETGTMDFGPLGRTHVRAASVSYALDMLRRRLT